MLNVIGKCDIYPGVHSDHSIVSLKLGNAKDNTRGKGLWKFNNDLLHDITYVQSIKKIIANCKLKYSDAANKSQIWELTKIEIRSFTRPYCVKKKKDRDKLKNDLEKRMLE